MLQSAKGALPHAKEATKIEPSSTEPKAHEKHQVGTANCFSYQTVLLHLQTILSEPSPGRELWSDVENTSLELALHSAVAC